jgi:hypothetical protein
VPELRDPPLQSSASDRRSSVESSHEDRAGTPSPAPASAAPEQPHPNRPSRPSARTRTNPFIVVGSCLAGLVLVAYFVWLCVQMGGHAQTGAAPLIAVFTAALLGIGAGALALALGRRR